MDELITDISEKHKVPPELLRKLIDHEQEKVHLERRRNAVSEIITILTDYLNTHDYEPDL